MFRALFVAFIIALAPFAKASDIPNDKTLRDFQINISLVPLTSAGSLALDGLELKLLQNNMSYVPVNTPGTNDYFHNGLMFIGPQGKVIGYIASGGMFDGSYWKLAFDPEMSSSQRLRLLALAIPYVDKKMAVLEKEWSNFKADEARPMNSIYMRVDFLNSDAASNRWFLERFQKYPLTILEDTSKIIQYSIEQVKKSTPSARIDTEVENTNKVITGIQFGNAYSPNLQKMAELKADGSIVITDTRTGKVLATLLPQDQGVPKIKMSSTQLVLDYGPGKKRYHYGVAEFTLLYTVDNWQAPKRPAGMSGNMCQTIFLR